MSPTSEPWKKWLLLGAGVLVVGALGHRVLGRKRRAHKIPLDGRKRVGQLTDEEYAERVRAKKQADEAARVARSAKLLKYKSPLDRVEIALRNLTKAEVAHKKATTIRRKNPNTERAWNKTHDDLEASRADYEAARAAYHARQG